MLWAISVLAALALAATMVAAMNPVNCTKSCSDIRISFPFGIEDGCGDPDPLFRLGCSEGILTGFLSGVNVTDINYEKEMLTINGCSGDITKEFLTESFVCSGKRLNIGSFIEVGSCLWKIDSNATARPNCYMVVSYSVSPVNMQVEHPLLSVPWPKANAQLQSECNSCTRKYPGATCGYDPNESNEFQCCLFNECHNTTAVMDAEEPDSSPARHNTGAIVGGAVAGGAALALAALVIACCVARRRRAVKSRNLILGGPSNSFDAKKQQHQVLSKSGRILYSNDPTSSYTQSTNSDGSSFYAVDMSSSAGSGSGGDGGGVAAGGGSNSTRFTYQELRQATDNFSEDGRLGDGGFGTVYKGKLRDGRVVAVKKLNPWNAQGKHQFDNEVTILSRVTHPHLVRLYGCCIEQELLLVYEFVANGTLADHLHDNRGDYLSWDTRLTVAIQCAEALAFLHTNVCYHRDVKSTNILLDDHYHCKVGDFGLSRLVPSLELTHITTAPQGTPGYLDPDYHQTYQLTDKSDVYSLGVVLMELISSQRAVDMCRDRKEINLASMAVSRIQCGELDKLVDPKLGGATDPVRAWMVECVAELGFSCLAADKEDRPSMKEVAARLRAIEEEGKVRYLGQMAAIRSGSGGGDGDGAVRFQRMRSKPRSSPTSVQAQWPSSSTSPGNSAGSL